MQALANEHVKSTENENSENAKNHFGTICRIFSFKNLDRMEVLAIKENPWETPKNKKFKLKFTLSLRQG